MPGALPSSVLADEQMNNNLRMSGAIALMLKKSKDRRQHEALEAAFKVRHKRFRQVVNGRFPNLIRIMNHLLTFSPREMARFESNYVSKNANHDS